MRKIGEEIRFQQICDFIEPNIAMVAKKPQSDKLEAIENRLKDLDLSYKKISQKLTADKRLNQGDVRSKLNGYLQQKEGFKKRLDSVIQDYRIQLLTKKTSNSPLKNNDRNMHMLKELREQKGAIQGMFEETTGIIKDTNVELYNQTKDTKAFVEETYTAQVELDLISQFMNTISNRNLLTKIILVLLIIFLGLADVAILVLKIL